MKATIESSLKKSMRYLEYRELLENLLSQGKTTGDNHSEQMLKYAELNISRMNKWDKIFKPSEEVKKAINEIQRPELWLVITEGWCGDAAQNLPLLKKMADLNDMIDFKVVLRDQNLELMDHFLTNGGRAIPKMIRIDANTLEVLGDWGARPEAAQKIVVEAKGEGLDYATPLHIWYAKNKGEDIQREIIKLLQPAVV